MREDNIPEKCRTCERLRKTDPYPDGSIEYYCSAGRIPDLEPNCDRYEKGEPA